MPTKAEGDLFVSGSAVLETACCSDSIRMSHDAKLMNSHIVVVVGVGHATSETHDLGNLVITKGRASAIGLEKLTKRFGARNIKHDVCSPSNIDHCKDRVEDCCIVKLFADFSNRNRIWMLVIMAAACSWRQVLKGSMHEFLSNRVKSSAMNAICCPQN